MDSTLLVSGFDSVYGSTELNINFPQTGAGFLAHTAISRGLYYLTQQYRDFRHNIMSYYSTTGFSQHASLDYFFKKNDHSHFTTGIDKIVVLNRLTASKDLTIKVYNVASQEEGQEIEQIEFITTLQDVGKKYGFKVVSTTSPQAYFRDFKNPTFVIEDEYNGQEFDLESFQNKIAFLQEVFVSETFNVESNVSIFTLFFLKKLLDFRPDQNQQFNEMLKSQIKSEDFISSLYQTLTTTQRNPLRLTPESITHKDLKSVSLNFLHFKHG